MNRPGPKVSVVIPTYNRASFLRDAVSSVLKQTYRELELIVVDDGSTDETLELLSSIDDERLQVLERPHRGISATLNAGIALARGELFARLDSDDLWHPDMLETLIPRLEEDRKLGFVYGRARAMSPEGTLVEHVQGGPPRFSGDCARSLLFDDCTCNIALVARRALIDRAGGFDEELLAHEDWDLWLRIARFHDFRFVDRELALIRRHDDNLTGMSSPNLAAVLETRREPLDKFFAERELPPELREMSSVAYSNVDLYVGQRWLHAGQARRAVAAFRRAMGSSRHPVVTAARIVWLAGLVPRLRRSAAGRRIVQRFAELRRRLRER